MNNSLLNKFTPKEPNFFPILKEMTDVILVVSELIIECVQISDYDNSVKIYKKIKEQELKGDVLSNRVFAELNSTFLTPFDREDIQQLANRLDDVIDFINRCAKRIVLYHPNEIPSSALELANIIKECAINIDKSVDQLYVLKKNSRKIQEYCKILHLLENKADDVYDNFLIDLFENQKDAVELIKLKEIMSELEKATDAAEYVGKVIKTIIIKYA